MKQPELTLAALMPIAVVALLAASLVLVAAAPAQAQLMPTSAWLTAPSYGEGVQEHSCVISNGYMYCVGGNVPSGCLVNHCSGLTTTSDAWYAPITSSGPGTWQQTTSYGPPDTPDIVSHNAQSTLYIADQSCVTSRGYIYCIGGREGYVGDTIDPNSGTQTTPVYGGPTGRVGFASLSPSGIGAWGTTTPYTVPKGASWFTDVLTLLGQVPDTVFIGGSNVYAQSCATDDQDVYCVGGFSSFSIPILLPGSQNVPTNLVLYAPINSDHTLGDWKFAGTYAPGAAIYHSCVISGGYIYCVGGEVASNWYQYLQNPFTGNFANPSSDVWYAPILPGGGVGAWAQTTSFGGGGVEKHSCTAILGNIVCIDSAKEVWAAELSDAGVGAWAHIGTYPTATVEHSNLTHGPLDDWVFGSCANDNTNVICVGGAGSNPNSYFFGGEGVINAVNYESFQATIEPKDSLSCGQLGNAVWDSSSSTCKVPGNFSLSGNTTLVIDSGVTLAIGDANTCVPSPTRDCVGPLVVNNNSAISISSGGELVNFGTFNNSAVSISFGGILVNIGTFNNNGVIDDGGTFDNRGNLFNYGEFHETGISASQTGIFVNRGNLTNSGFFAADANQPGNVTVVVNGNTCQNSSAEISSTSPFMIFGGWNSQTSTCELDPVPGLPPNVVFPYIVPQNVSWQVPAGVTLLNLNELDMHGELDNAGTVINQPISSPFGPGTLFVFDLFNNQGTLIDKNGGSTSVIGTLINTGTINLQTGGGLFVGGTLNNASSINMDSGTTLGDSGLINNTGTIFNSGSVNTVNATATIVNSGGGSIVNQNGGTTDGAGGTIKGTVGAVTITLDQTSCPSFGAVWLAATNTCLFDQTKFVTFAATKILAIAPGVTLLTYGQLTAPGKIDNHGAIVNGGFLSIGDQTGGSMVNEADGTFTNFLKVINAPTASLTNRGTFVNAARSDAFSGFENIFDNQGTFTNAGTVNNYSTIQDDNIGNGGAGVTVNNGTINDLCGGSFQNNSGNFSGNPVVAAPCSPAAPLEPTITTITSTPNPSFIGQIVTLTATMIPNTVSGSVTFFDGSTPLGTVTLPPDTSQVTLTTSTIGVGTRAITAQYSGDTFRAGSTSDAIAQIVSNSDDQPSGVALADFDGDGHLDMAVTQSGSSTVIIFHGNGDGTFTELGAYPVGGVSTGPLGNPPGFITAADLNGDGKLDLVITTFSGLSVLLGNGDGTFQPATNYFFGIFNSTHVVTDLNGDGRLDIVVGSTEHPFVLLGKGDGTFSAPVALTAVQGGDHVAIADFNHDGIPDLVASGNFFNTVSVMLGKGDGTFQAPTTISTLQEPGPVVAGDFNGDGNVDIAVVQRFVPSCGFGFCVSVFPGHGDGTFGAAKAYPVSNGNSMIIGDLNGDGIPDLALSGDSVSVLLGNGDGSFQPELIFPAGNTPLAITAGDLNGDGFLDLVAANALSNDITVLLGPFGKPLTPTINVTGGVFVYDGTPHTATCSATGANNVTVAGSCALTYNGSAAAPSNAGTYAVTAVFTSSNNRYTNANGSASVTINPAGPLVTVTGGTFTYDGNTHAATCAATGTGGSSLAGTCSITYNGATGAPSNASSYAVIASFTSNDGNYTNGSASGLLTINPAALTVTANNASKIYGQPLPAFSVSFSGFVSADGPAVLQGTLTFNTSATATSPVGSYAVTPAGLNSGNYTVTFAPGTLTVTPASLTIAADNKSTVYGSALPFLTFTASGFVNGDTAASLNPQPSLNTTATTASAAGSYPISVGGAVNPNYNITFAPGTLTVSPASLTVTADSKTKVYGAALPALTFTASGFVNGDQTASLNPQPSLSTPATPASTVGVYAISVGGAANPNYTITFVPGTLAVTQATLSIVADSKTKIYGAALPALTFTASGFVNGDTAASLNPQPSLSTTATTASGVGTYAIAVGGAANANYMIAYVQGVLTVTPAQLTITANNVTKVLNAPNPPLTWTATGFVNGDGLGVLLPAPSCSTAAVTNSPVGSYTVTCSGASAANYTLIYLPGTLRVVYSPNNGHVIQSPINGDGTSVYKQGRTVPASFRVFDANGVSIGPPGTVVSFYLTGIESGTSVTAVQDIVDTNNPDTSFRWDGQQWIFNISTKNLNAGYTNIYTITLNDGSSIVFQYGLR